MSRSIPGRAVGYTLSLVVPLLVLGTVAPCVPVSYAAVVDSLSPRSADNLGARSWARFNDDSLRGRSGKLFVRLLSPDRVSTIAPFAHWFGGQTLQRPGVYRVADSSLRHPFAFITLHPFDAKRTDRIGSYRLGFWPAERRRKITSEAYENPTGFIEVSSDNVSTPVSEHFQLGDFLTHDQASVWPKYLVLHEDLVDKLELVIAELEQSGIAVRTMKVMSGFRTPQYNAKGGRKTGRAEMSRHMYGDAADVFVDNNNDGRMDDLNRDGRVDSRDAKVIVTATERVERRHADLVGGAAVYKATKAHGPFAHIDVRGNRARWGRM